MIVGETYTLSKQGYDIYRELGGDQPKSIYKKILKEYNQEGMRQMIHDARYFPFGGYMGGLKVLRKNRNYKSNANAAIDWKASKAAKQKLLDEGKVPMSKENPDGVEWLVKFSFDDDQYVLIDWNCYTPANRSKANINRVLVYKFIASRGKVGVKTELKEHIATNPLGIYKYPNVKDVSKKWSTGTLA